MVVEVTVPTGVQVLDLPDQCSMVATGVRCALPDVTPVESQGVNVPVEFAATGTYTFTSTATADQPDVNGDSSAEIDIVVVDESADLDGEDETARVVVADQATYRVSHAFSNRGPTAAAEASVVGALSPGAEIEPGSFVFAGFDSVNRADELCTVSATSFSCAPLSSGGIFYAVEPFIYYDVVLPTTPTTIEATATITGRADPVSANNASVVTIEVAAPAAELFAQLTAVPGIVPAGEPVAVSGPIDSAGDIDAEDVVAVLDAPSDWTAALPSGPPEPGVSCSVEPSGPCDPLHTRRARDPGVVDRRGSAHTSGWGHRYGNRHAHSPDRYA